MHLVKLSSLPPALLLLLRLPFSIPLRHALVQLEQPAHQQLVIVQLWRSLQEFCFLQLVIGLAFSVLLPLLESLMLVIQ